MLANRYCKQKNTARGNGRRFVCCSFSGTFRRNVRKVLGTPALRRICGSPPRYRLIRIASVDAARREALPVNRLNQDPGYLLREGAVFECGPPSQRFLEFIGHVGTNKYTFPIRHNLL
jgi:hypothetical protein